jgi:thiol:disulfide interchange protein
MQKFLLFIALLCVSINSIAQSSKVVKWTTSYKEVKPGEGELRIKAVPKKGYHIFSKDPGGDGSLVGTNVKLPKVDGITYIGGITEEGKKLTHTFPGIDGDVNWYEEQVTFVQKVKVKDRKVFDASIDFMSCNDVMCERPEDNYKVKVDMYNNTDGTRATNPADKITTEDTIKKSGIDSPTNTTNVPATTNIDANNNTEDTDTIAAQRDGNGNIVYGKYGTIVSDCGETAKKEMSPLEAFLYGLIGGFLALFFPCTLPMIPMTISFFLKGDSDKRKGMRKGILYGFFIFLVYFLLSLPFLFFNLGGQELSGIATNPWLNLVFFAIFIIFAFSLFGYYDISLPSFLVNKVDAKSDPRTPVGIFFMALTLAIVSFSCTGPILGLVLGNVKNSSLITPAMAGFGIGLGVPFALFAIFPNLLKAMPKSGGWLTTLKVIFGFVEVAFALKFLSNADLVKQWGLIKRELFMAIWILITVVMGIYLFGKIKMKKYEVPYVNNITRVLGVLCFGLAAYLSLDFFGINANLFGFPPPKFYSYFHKEDKLKKGEVAKTHQLKGLTIYLDLEDAIAEGKKQNKPVMIDFTGWACVNCRQMEENVWTQNSINEILKNKYIIASLYVDDDRDLPKEKQFESTYLKKTATTIGDKWFDLSLRHFYNAAQPYYALIDPINNRILNTPKGYTPKIKEYEKFLNCGITNFNSLNGISNK